LGFRENVVVFSIIHADTNTRANFASGVLLDKILIYRKLPRYILALKYAFFDVVNCQRPIRLLNDNIYGACVLDLPPTGRQKDKREI
jgi:hypothetical protein